MNGNDINELRQRCHTIEKRLEQMEGTILTVLHVAKLMRDFIKASGFEGFNDMEDMKIEITDKDRQVSGELADDPVKTSISRDCQRMQDT